MYICQIVFLNKSATFQGCDLGDRTPMVSKFVTKAIAGLHSAGPCTAAAGTGAESAKRKHPESDAPTAEMGLKSADERKPTLAPGMSSPKLDFGGKFSQVLGVAPGGVLAYSCHYRSASAERARPGSHYLPDGTYTGYRWQCVEFARRWLILTRGVTFASVGMAYEIFDLTEFAPAPSAHRSANPSRGVPITCCRDGASQIPPEGGDLLIWDARHDGTGHVAVVTAVDDRFVYVAEQNWDDKVWPSGQSFGRKLKLRCGPDGSFTVVDRYMVGWIRIHT